MATQETTKEMWCRIEGEARAAGLAELDVLERTPLEFGQPIAWTLMRFGRTDDLSPLHRVGMPIEGRDHTTCGEAIPAPALWLTLSHGLAHALTRCRYCEAEYHRLSRSEAA